MQMSHTPGAEGREHIPKGAYRSEPGCGTGVPDRGPQCISLFHLAGYILECLLCTRHHSKQGIKIILAFRK